MRLWDVGSGKELLTLRGHEGYVISVAFSPDGIWLASASWDKTVRLWWVPRSLDELLAEAEKRLPRQLTPEQEERFYLRSTTASAPLTQ